MDSSAGMRFFLFLGIALASAHAQTVAISPDGTGEAYADGTSVHIRTPGSSKEIRAEEGMTTSDTSFLWSPDGRRLAVSVQVKRSNMLYLYGIRENAIEEIPIPDAVDRALENLGPRPGGRFFYLTPIRWAGDTLQVVVSKNLIKGEGIFEWWSYPVILSTHQKACELVSVGEKHVSADIIYSTLVKMFPVKSKEDQREKE